MNRVQYTSTADRQIIERQELQRTPIDTSEHSFWSVLCCWFNSYNQTRGTGGFNASHIDENPRLMTTSVSQAAESVLGVTEKGQQQKESARLLMLEKKSPNLLQNMQKVIMSVSPIAEKFTAEASIEEQRVAHSAAKDFLTEHLTSIGATVAFISPTALVETIDVEQIQMIPLLEDLFYWENTQGVAEDIQRDGNRSEDNIVLYSAASQFNGCEAPGPYTLLPGQAVATYKRDRTQGPQSQLQFHPDQIELINCGGNLGFNGLSNILSEGTKSIVEHGYFRPQEKDADTIIQALSGSGIEYMCVANRPYDERRNKYGAKPVHMALMSAPAFGYGGRCSKGKRDQIEFLCALQGFRAQFQHCIDLAQTEGKPVIFKAAGMGLGVYGNQAINVAKGLYVAAKEFEAQLQKNNVQIRFQVFRGIGNTRDLVNMLGLREWVR